MRRLAAALWSGLWLVALLAGPPWALLAVFGVPFPRHLPQQPDLRQWIVSAAVLLLWAVWLVLLVLVGLQVRAAVRRLRLPGLRLANPPDGLLAGLVGAAVVAYTTAGFRGAVLAAPPPVAGTATQPPPAVAAGTPADPGLQGAAAPHAPAADAGVQVDGVATAGDPPVQATADRAAPRGVDPVPGAVVGPAGAAAGEDPAGVEGATGGDGPHRDHPNGHDRGAHRDADHDLGGPGGVELPGGGWVSRDTATAVTATVGLLWLRRRRRYLPRPPSGSDRPDADLAGLPDTAAAIVDAIQNPDMRDPAVRDRDHLDDRSDRYGDEPADTGATPEPTLVAPATVTAAAVGHDWDGPLRPADLPACGVGLTGVGAADAARGILTAALLAGGPGQPDRDAQVLTTAADLRTLLGPCPVGHGRPPGLNVFTDLAEMLPVLESQVLARDQAQAAHRHPDPTAAGADPAQPPPGPFPPLLVLTTAPAEADQARRLAVLLLSPRTLGITGALLGLWRHGPTWRVNPDGTTHLHAQPTATGLWRWTSAGARLCVLPAAAAVDLLALQAQARPYRHHLHHPAPPRVWPGPDPGGPGRRTAGGSAAVPRRTGADRPLQLRLFGGVRLCHVRDPGTPLRLGRSTAVQVLLYLAVHPQGATSGQLAAALWPGVRPHPVDRVYAAASALRSTVLRATGLQILTRVGERYRLNPDRLQVDLWQLHATVDVAAATSDAGSYTAVLRTVINLYTGELAAGQPGAWLVPHREAARRHAVDAYTTLAQLSDPPTAAALLHTALQVDPYNEHLQRAATLAYRANGQPDLGHSLLAELAQRLADIDDPPDPNAKSEPD